MLNKLRNSYIAHFPLQYNYIKGLLINTFCLAKNKVIYVTAHFTSLYLHPVNILTYVVMTWCDVFIFRLEKILTTTWEVNIYDTAA